MKIWIYYRFSEEEQQLCSEKLTPWPSLTCKTLTAKRDLKDVPLTQISLKKSCLGLFRKFIVWSIRSTYFKSTYSLINIFMSQFSSLTTSSAPPTEFNATNKIISPYRGALPARNLTHWNSNYVSLGSCQWRFLTCRALYPGSLIIWQDDMSGKSNTRPESLLTWSVVKGRDEEWLQDD